MQKQQKSGQSGGQVKQTKQQTEKSEKQQKLQQIQQAMDERMQSMDQLVKKYQISSVETRALNNVFDRIERAQEFYNHDDSRHYSGDDDEDKKMEEKSKSKYGGKKKLRNNNVNSIGSEMESKQKKNGPLGKVVTEKHFTYKELKIVLNELQYYPSNETIREMLWDIDEDNTGCITKGKFELMYKRCRFDTSNFEPRSLYNVVQYLMFLYNSSGNRSDYQEFEDKSKDNKIMITFENTLEILYVIYGRELMKKYTKLLFGEDEASGYNSGINEKQISLQEYLQIMKKHDVDARNEDKVNKKNKYLQPPKGEDQYEY